MNRLFVAAAFVALLAGCQSQPTTQTAAPVEDRTAAGTTPGGASTAGAGTGSVAGSQQGTRPGSTSGNPLRDPSSVLSKRVVYFDFDSYVVKDDYRPVIEANAKALTTNRRMKMAVEGHTDDRGSSEYNLALGQRRAEAVVKSLTLLGADQTQLEAVSFGEERPAVQGENEEAWAKNRRAELASR